MNSIAYMYNSNFITKKFLINLYLKENMSMAKIAKVLSCDPSTIQRKLRQYKIRPRTLFEAAKKVLITKKELKNLYYKKKFSTEQIGKLFHCNHVTILNKMKFYKLRTRTKLGLRKPIDISEKILKYLYKKCKFSHKQIAKKFKCSKSAIEKLMNKYKIKSRSLSESQMIYTKSNFSKNLTEKAYLVGFRLGDLYIKPVKLQIQMSCSSSRYNQIILIKSLFERYSTVIITRKRIIKGKRIWDIRCLLNKSFKFLIPKKDNIESWILKNKKLFVSFWAGYIDAEGHIFTKIYKNSKTSYSGFEVQSYDKNILLQSWQKLNELGIKCRKPKINKLKGYTQKNGLINRKDLWRLGIYNKEDLYLFLTTIESHIKHRKRKKDLLKAKNNLITRLDYNLYHKIKLPH